MAWLGAALITLLAGCASLPPGADYPKTPSAALSHPEQTRIGKQLAAAVAGHPGTSGFRLLPLGIDSFLLRAELADAADRTLDVQYFLIQSDDTGQFLIEALLKAAERGVRIRVLIDDVGSFGRDAQLRLLAAYPNVHVRLFNPAAYRGSIELLHYAEYLGDAARLNYRMHNKLFVADNEMAIVGGRNIGDEYFKGGAQFEFDDYDVVAAGPIVRRLSASFDAFWNSSMAIPIAALTDEAPSARDRDRYRNVLAAHHAFMNAVYGKYMRRLAAGEPLASILNGKDPLVWAKGEVVYDSPHKARIEKGEQGGRLLQDRLGEVSRQVQKELIIVTPYLVPGPAEMKFFKELRQRKVAVRILTNSLASSDVPIVHAGYQAVRMPLLDMGVDLYELRPSPGRPVVHGDPLKSSSPGRFALHAKVFVFDRRRIFIGSMNLDQRSLHLNTEIGLIIDSPELARQIVERFAEITQPANSYALRLSEPDETGQRHPIWHTLDHGKPVDYDYEPGASPITQIQVDALSILPIDGLL